MEEKQKEIVREYIEENPEIRLLIAGSHYKELWEYLFELGEDDYNNRLKCWLLLQALVGAGVDTHLKVIPQRAFSSVRYPTKTIYIPKGVTSIGKRSFSYSENVNKIVLPDSLQEIGEEAFYFISDLKSINIPEKVTVIPNRCFYVCRGLEKISLPKGLQEIGTEAFSDNRSLKAIDLPDGLKIIGSYAFFQCIKIKNMVVPNSVDEIGDSAFSGMHSLESITLPKKFKGQASRFGLRGKGSLITWV